MKLKTGMGRHLKNVAHLLGRHSSFFGRGLYRNLSYSQEGEDRVLARYFENRKTGYYVDIGAHHPFRFSNTALFYNRGWCGINVDAWPGSMAPFRRARPRDTNLEIGIAREAGVAPLFIFNDAALNTFDRSLAEFRNRHPWFIERTVEVPVRPLSEVLSEHVPVGRDIDFASIDVEGHDLEVLKSNDWDRFRPEILLTEMVEAAFDTLQTDPVGEFLFRQGYIPYAKTINTSFYIRIE